MNMIVQTYSQTVMANSEQNCILN